MAVDALRASPHYPRKEERCGKVGQETPRPSKWVWGGGQKQEVLRQRSSWAQHSGPVWQRYKWHPLPGSLHLYHGPSCALWEAAGFLGPHSPSRAPKWRIYQAGVRAQSLSLNSRDTKGGDGDVQLLAKVHAEVNQLYIQRNKGSRERERNSAFIQHFMKGSLKNEDLKPHV